MKSKACVRIKPSSTQWNCDCVVQGSNRHFALCLNLLIKYLGINRNYKLNCAKSLNWTGGPITQAFQTGDGASVVANMRIMIQESGDMIIYIVQTERITLAFWTINSAKDGLFSHVEHSDRKSWASTGRIIVTTRSGFLSIHDFILKSAKYFEFETGVFGDSDVLSSIQNKRLTRLKFQYT